MKNRNLFLTIHRRVGTPRSRNQNSGSGEYLLVVSSHGGRDKGAKNREEHCVMTRQKRGMHSLKPFL
jgi:hypothetical protein